MFQITTSIGPRGPAAVSAEACGSWAKAAPVVEMEISVAARLAAIKFSFMP
jgi:hypothetical protein